MATSYERGLLPGVITLSHVDRGASVMRITQAESCLFFLSEDRN
jgi:hypothetical protein